MSTTSRGRLIIATLFGLYFGFIVLEQIGQILDYKRKLPLFNAIRKTSIFPFIEQNWSMFAPNPPTSTKRILLRFKINNNEQEWQDIHQLIIDNNTQTMFSINQRMIKYLQNVLGQLEQSYYHSQNKTGEVDYSTIKKNIGYKSLESYAKLILHQQGINPSSTLYLKIRIIHDAFPNFDNRHLDFYTPHNHHLSSIELPYQEIIW